MPLKYQKIFYYQAFANLMFFLGNSLFILFPVYLKGLGASESFIGFMNNIDKILAVGAAAVLGMVIHRFDRLAMIRAAYLLLAMVFALYIFVDPYSPLMPLVRILHGTGFSFGMILGTTLIFDIVEPADAARAIGIYGITGAITNAISPMIGEYLLSIGTDHRVLFFMSSLFVLLAFTAAMFMPPYKSVHDTAEVIPATIGFSGLFRDNAYALNSAAVFIFGGGFGLLFTFLPNYASTFTGLNYSFFFASQTLVLISIRLFIFKYAERAPRLELITYIFTGGALHFLFYNFFGTNLMLIITGALYGAVHGLLYPLMNTLLVELAPRADKGRSNAVFTALFNAGMLGFSLIAGFLIDLFEWYPVAYNFAALMFFIAAFMVKKSGGNCQPHFIKKSDYF
jgi:MFS family permease